MHLNLKYTKHILIILLLLTCSCFNTYTQTPTNITEDTVVSLITDEENNKVSLYIPESMDNDQSLRRIYGTPGGVLGMFETLYSQKRRTESYEAAIRELCLQPAAYEQTNALTRLEADLEAAGATVDEVEAVLNIMKQGALSIKQNFIKGGTLTRDIRNKIANAARKLEVHNPHSAFIETCDVIGGISTDLDATRQITDIVAGSLLLNALATDNALVRLEEIEKVVQSEEKADEALKEAVEQAKINLLASQSKIGSFAVYVNDHIRDITDSAISLGAGLAEMAGKLSGPFAMWVGAPMMTYNTLKAISNQWEMAQDAVTLATLTKFMGEHIQGDKNITENLTSYGQYAFYLKLEETFDVGMAKFHDFINIVGSTNRDWSQYYRERKENTKIVGLKISGISEVSEKNRIEKVINNFFHALNERKWDEAKNYCIYESEAWETINIWENQFSCIDEETYDINISIDYYEVALTNEFVEVYLNGISTIIINGEVNEEASNETWVYLQKIEDDWLFYRMGPSKKDTIKILSVYPNSGLQNGLETHFTIKVEYNLVTYQQGEVSIGFNTTNPAWWDTIESENFIIRNGTGTHTFNATIVPKNWCGTCNIIATLDEEPENDRVNLDSDNEILYFKNI